MSLEKFKADIREKGLAKTNRFMVELNAARILSATTEPYRSNLEMIRLMCDTAQLPGVSFGTAQVRSYGESREIPYEKLFEPVNLTFYVDRTMMVKRLFDDWMLTVQGSDRNYNYPIDYMADEINIFVYDTTNKETYKVSLKKAYPKTVGAIQLDYSAREVMKLNVSIQYEYFEITATTPTLISSIGNAGIIEDTIFSGLGSASYFNNFLDYQQTLNTYNYSAGEIISSFYSDVRSSLNGLVGSITSGLDSFF